MVFFKDNVVFLQFNSNQTTNNYFIICLMKNWKIKISKIRKQTWSTTIFFRKTFLKRNRFSFYFLFFKFQKVKTINILYSTLCSLRFSLQFPKFYHKLFHTKKNFLLQSYSFFIFVLQNYSSSFFKRSLSYYKKHDMTILLLKPMVWIFPHFLDFCPSQLIPNFSSEIFSMKIFLWDNYFSCYKQDLEIRQF